MNTETLQYCVGLWWTLRTLQTRPPKTHCTTLQRTATHFNALQHIATHCNALQHTATHSNTQQNTAKHSNTLQHTETRCNTLQHTATHCTTLQHTATHCSTLQHTATHWNTQQQTAAHCNTLQHTATHCNTLQHTATAMIRSRTRSVSRIFAPMTFCLLVFTFLFWRQSKWSKVLISCLLWHFRSDSCSRTHNHARSLSRSVSPPLISSVLPCVAVRCGVLQCAAESYEAPPIQGTASAVCCSALQCVAGCCNALQLLRNTIYIRLIKRPRICVAVCCSVLQCVAVCCSAPQNFTRHHQHKPHQEAPHQQQQDSCRAHHTATDKNSQKSLC